MSDEMNNNKDFTEENVVDGTQNTEGADIDACEIVSEEGEAPAKKSKNKKAIVITSIVAAVVLIAICVATALAVYNIFFKYEVEKENLFTCGLTPARYDGLWGYVNKDGEPVTDFQYTDARAFSENGVAVVRIDSKYFLINTNGEAVSEEYGYIDSFKENQNVALFLKQGKYGIINHDGEVVISAEYDNVLILDDDFIIAKKVIDNKPNYTLFDHEGNELSNFDYRIADYSRESKTFVVYKDNESSLKYGIIDVNGNVLTDLAYDYVTSMNSHGYSMFRQGEKWGVINKKGKVILEPKYDTAGYQNTIYLPTEDGVFADTPAIYYGREFSEDNVAIVGYKDGDNSYVYGVINHKGEEVIDVKYHVIIGFSEEDGIAVIGEKSSNGEILYGYATSKGKILVKPQLKKAYGFYNGYATASLEDCDVIVDKFGNISRLDGDYSLCVNTSASDTLPIITRVVGEKTLYGFTNSKCEIVIEAQYDYVYPFSDCGYTTVKKDNSWFLINTKGEIVSREYKTASRVYDDGYAVVSIDGERFGVIDTDDEIVVDRVYDKIYNTGIYY